MLFPKRAYAGAALGFTFGALALSLFLPNAFPDVSPPSISSFTKSGSLSITPELMNSTPKWYDTGINVEAGKLMFIEWKSLGNILTSDNVRKYRVLVKFDPRLSARVSSSYSPVRHQVLTALTFIAPFNKETQKYEWDYYNFNDGYFKLLDSDIPALKYEGRKEYFQKSKDYFNFIGRDKITLKKGEVISAKIITSDVFFSQGLEEINAHFTLADFKNKLLPYFLSTASPFTNSLLNLTYGAMQRIAQGISDPSNRESFLSQTTPYYTGNNAYLKEYLKSVDGILYNNIDKYIGSYVSFFTGNPLEPNLKSVAESQPCNTDICIGINSTTAPLIISPGKTTFGTHLLGSDGLLSPGKMFLFEQKDEESSVDFNLITDFHDQNNPWPYGQYTADGIIPGVITLKNNYDIPTAQRFYWTGKPIFIGTPHIISGRFLLEVEIGSASEQIGAYNDSTLSLQYTIQPTNTDMNLVVNGINVPNNLRLDAPKSGRLYVRALTENENSTTQNLSIKYGAFTGNNVFSSLIYDRIVKPVTESMQSAMALMYSSLAQAPVFINIVNSLVILYIFIFGMMITLGLVNFSLKEIITRLVKIIFVFQIIQPYSWNFFNYYLFETFLNSTQYLISNASNASSSIENIFGFIDPFMNFVFSKELWICIIAMLLQLWNGYTFIAIMLIYSIWSFTKDLIKASLSLMMSYLTICAMIAMAPLFIAMLIFDKTKFFFDNWATVIFGAILTPFLVITVIIFFENLISQNIQLAVVGCSWKEVFSFKLHVDVPILDVILEGISAALPSIYFFVPDNPGDYTIFLTALFTLFVLVVIASKSVEIAESISGTLTNVIIRTDRRQTFRSSSGFKHQSNEDAHKNSNKDQQNEGDNTADDINKEGNAGQRNVQQRPQIPN